MTENTSDLTLNNTADVESTTKIPLSELQKKYGIGREALYSRMRYLQITTWKISGKAYLDVDQVASMDDLHAHVQLVGKMEGYPVPEPTGPRSVEEEPTAALTISSSQLNSPPQESTTLTVTEPSQLSTPNYSPKQKRKQSSQQVDDVAAIVNSAQNKAAGTLIAENILAQHFIQNPDLLSDELKAKIKESGEMPSVDPFAYADSLINMAMGSKNAA
ncbi:MAG: hypothetical protein ACIWVG_00005 [Gloeotrichia echinulata HAB0833]